jgi:hypothetical protein
VLPGQLELLARLAHFLQQRVQQVQLELCQQQPQHR